MPSNAQLRRALDSALALVISLLLSCGIAPADTVFDRWGFDQNRDYFSELPYEHIDPMTGNPVLTFTDLVLPGNAGFDLKIQRTYNSKVYRDYGVLRVGKQRFVGACDSAMVRCELGLLGSDVRGDAIGEPGGRCPYVVGTGQ